MEAEKIMEATEEGGFRWWGRVRGGSRYGNTVMVGMAVWGRANTRVKLTFVLYCMLLSSFGAFNGY